MDPSCLGSGPGSTPHGTPQAVESLTNALPSPAVVQSSSLGLGLSQLLLLLQALQSWISLKIQDFLQSSLLFGSTTQNLASIPHGIAEAALAIYGSLRHAFPPGSTSPCVTTPREEEMTLVSRPIPGALCRPSGEVAGVGSLLEDVDPGSVGSGPGSTPHGTPQAVESLPDALPSPVVVCSSSLKLVLLQLLLELEPRALLARLSLKAGVLLLDLKELLCSFPWVQVTEEKQEANALLQSTAVYQVVQCVVDQLEQNLGPRQALREAGVLSSLLLQHHLLHLVAHTTAWLLPDEESADQQRQNEVVAALPPLPPQFTISSELVEVLLLQLVLTLHPVDGCGSQPLSPQDLLVLFVHMSTDTLHILTNTPGLAVDTCSPPPVCNTRRSVLQLQSSLLRRFGSATQDLLALKDPALLASISHGVAEAALAIYRSLRWAFPPGSTSPCVTTPREEDSAEMALFSRPLPGALRGNLCRYYGEWLGNGRLFNRAFRETSDEAREEDEGDGKAPDIGPLLEVPLVPEGPVGAVQRVFGSSSAEIPRSRSGPEPCDFGPLLPPPSTFSAHGSSSTRSGDDPTRLPERVSWNTPLESTEQDTATTVRTQRKKKKWSSCLRGLLCCGKVQPD